MISTATAVLASAVWIVTTIFWRSTTRRKYAVGTDGQPPINRLQANVLRTSTLVREADPAATKVHRLFAHSHSASPPRGPGNQEVYRALVASGIFSKIDPGRVSAVSEQVEPVQFSPGDELDAQSTRGGRVYVIMSGKVKVVYRHPMGSEMVLTILGPKEIFGATKIFDPDSREVRATALTEVVAVPIERDRFMGWIADCPEFSDQVLRLFARWLKAATNSLTEFAFADVESRVANQLLLLRKRFGQREGEVVRVVHDLTLEDFSLLAGVAPEAMGKTLREFEERGWIRLEDRSMVVINAHALASVPHISASEIRCA